MVESHFFLCCEWPVVWGYVVYVAVEHQCQLVVCISYLFQPEQYQIQSTEAALPVYC